jgi:hypothetical protein
MSAPVNWKVGQRAVARWAENYSSCNCQGLPAYNCPCRGLTDQTDVSWRGGEVKEVLDYYCVMTFGKYSDGKVRVRKFLKKHMVEHSKDIPIEYKHEKIDEYADIVDIAAYKADKAKNKSEEIRRQREKIENNNEEIMKKKIQTMKISTEVNHTETETKIKLSKPASRKERIFRNIPHSKVIELEKAVNPKLWVFGDKELEKKVVQLTYITNAVGSFAGPFDRPMTMPVRLGEESLSHSEYTNYKHEPEEDHFKFIVDEEVWCESDTTNAIESLIPFEKKEESSLSGPCQNRKDNKSTTSQLFYTCKEEKCVIPCVCAVCNAERFGVNFFCSKHTEVNPITSGFDPVFDLMTVRNDDSYPVTKNLDLDETDGKCKTLQVIKFTGIPKNCEECKQELYDHEAHHEVVHEGCKFCDYIVVETNHFEVKNEIDFWHQKTITRKKLKTVCHICEKMFSKVGNLKEHIENIHLKNRQLKLKCKRCDFSTIYMRNLVHHRNNVHEHTKSKMICSFCKYSTYLKRDLKVHTEIMHENRLLFKCSHCKYKASHSKILKNHIKTVHTNTKEFQCEHCEFFSFYAKDLKRHIKRHHSEISCDKCPFKCNKKTELNAHIRNTHKDKPKLKCDHCDWDTTEKKKLTQHIRRKHN